MTQELLMLLARTVVVSGLVAYAVVELAFYFLYNRPNQPDQNYRNPKLETLRRKQRIKKRRRGR